MFDLYDIVFILIYFIVMALLLSSMYIRRLTGGDIVKSLALAVLIRVAIIVISLVVSTIGGLFGISLGAIEVAYIGGLWVSYAIARYFWEDRLSANKITNLTTLVLVITIMITYAITSIVSF